MNGDRSVGEQSEEPLEANNKDTRLFSNSMSRKMDPTLQLYDVIIRCLERAHPHVRYDQTFCAQSVDRKITQLDRIIVSLEVTMNMTY